MHIGSDFQCHVSGQPEWVSLVALHCISSFMISARRAEAMRKATRTSRAKRTVTIWMPPAVLRSGKRLGFIDFPDSFGEPQLRSNLLSLPASN
jgi:hypothetical protein